MTLAQEGAKRFQRYINALCLQRPRTCRRDYAGTCVFCQVNIATGDEYQGERRQLRAHCSCLSSWSKFLRQEEEKSRVRTK